MRISMVLVAYAALSTTTSRADQVTFDGEREGPESGYGISFLFGGGVAGFTNRTMRDTVKTRFEGAWATRMTVGTRRSLAIEIGSSGTVSNIDALNDSESGLLYGMAVEAAARYNLLPKDPWTPYGFIGAGWQRYTVRSAAFTLSDAGINPTDHSVVFPIGAGLSYRARSGFVADLRGTFRVAERSGLVLERMGATEYVPLHSWETSGAIGFEF